MRTIAPQKKRRKAELVESMVKSGISREELINWGGEEVFNQALALCNSGDVKDVVYDDEKLTVSGKIVQPSGFEMPVSLKLLENERIQSLCPCVTNQRYGRICPHVVAIGIACHILEMDPPEEKETPLKEKENEAKIEDEFIEVPAKPRFFAYLSGSRASLSISVNAKYGDISFPACSVQPPRTVWMEDEDDPLVRRVRSIAAERAAIKKLLKWGFEPGYSEGDLRHFISDPQKVLTFLGAGIPELCRLSWRFEFNEPLTKLTNQMDSIVPVVTIKDAAGGAFDVHYTFDANGKSISPAEVQAALNRGDGYLMREGRVILLDSGGIEALRDVFSDCAPSQNGAERGWFRVKATYAPYVKSSLDLVDCEVNASRAKYWRTMTRQHTAGNNAKFEPVPLGRLEKILRPYQKQGVYWMRFLENAGLSGLLADEMGLGKTIQTLAWLSMTRSDPRAHDENGKNLPALIVCPTSLVRNWEAEAERFTPHLKTLVVSGPDRAKNFGSFDRYDIIITSYALLQRDFDSAYLGQVFSAVVLDEAQNIKNRQTRNAKSVKSINCIQRLVLTGTPVENSVTDVWSIFDFLMPDYLGDYETFRDTFEYPILDGENAESTLLRLKRKIAPFILRRLKKSVAKDLPDKIIKISYCPMSDDSQREYTKALLSARTQAGDIIKAKGFKKSRFELLSLLMKLRQIASRAKIDTFMEQLLQAVESGHKILVFSQFVKMLSLLQKRLQEAGIAYCYLDGSTKDRIEQCNKFNRSPEIPVFLISLMAGGTGLNLTSADMVMHYDPWWNPAVEDQATDRAHRIGQKNKVYVMKMIASGSIEEKVLSLQRRKQAVISATVDTTDATVMETLTAADLNELLS
ncbi:MAG: SNF2 helicase associated domain-containing protein [Kiritimatiellae bacterium]|nr:SNF2 helicase associated domain-containing protein [Kiritimatiellia bacterium]